MKPRLTESAINKLRELLLYYEEQLVPQVGQRCITEILDRIEILIDNPDIGRVVPEFSTDNIRELIHKPFRVVHLRESSTIFIIRVWRSEGILELPCVRMKHNKAFKYVPPASWLHRTRLRRAALLVR